MPRKKIVQEEGEIILDNPSKPLETPKVEGVITLKASDPQLGGEYVRSFTNKEDAAAWKRRFNAVEI